MTMNDVRTQRLIEGRRRAAADTETSVLATVRRMAATAEAISFTAVHRAAGVSNWFVYNNPRVRSAIQEAMSEQKRQAKSTAERPLDDRSLRAMRAELAHARAEIRDLREERDKLRQRLQRDLGAQVDAMGKRELVERLRVLEQENVALHGALHQSTAECGQAVRDRDEAIADLDGTRLALRQMMRNQSLQTANLGIG